MTYFETTTMWVLLLLLVSLANCQDFLSLYDGIFNIFASSIEEHSMKILENLGNTSDANDLLIKMLDASTKIPTGLENGNPFDLGNFDECYQIHSGDIYGKYCLGTLVINTTMQKTMTMIRHSELFMLHSKREPRLAGLGPQYIGLHWAACVPSTMPAENISYLYQTYTEDLCYSKATEPALTTGAIVTIVILSIFLLIITVSTIFDIYLYYSKKESPHDLMIAFSFLSNGRKILTSSTNSDQLLCLNGIKAISMMWVIIGHEYLCATYGPVSNFLDLMKFEGDAANMFVKGATVSVDTFFLVGGLVTVYSFLKATDKGIKFNIVLFYIHRYLRLTPALGIVMLIHIFLLPYFGNGPLWKEVDTVLVETCDDTWWTTLLYITNYFRNGNCVPQTWYLAVDMQLFVLSPIILIPLVKWPLIALSSLGVLTVAGIIVPFTIAYVENLGTLFIDSEKYMDDYYNQTYTRFAPYVIGMALGYVIYELKKSKRNLNWHPAIVTGAWLVSLTGAVACVYAGYDMFSDTLPDRWSNSLYIAFNRPAWSVAVAGIIFLCTVGYGGPIDSFLSLSVFQFITKLSYSMYLVHYAVIIIRYASMRNVFEFSHIITMHNFWGDFMITLLLSLILCLSFESPIIILEKHLFGRGAPSKEKTTDKPTV